MGGAHILIEERLKWEYHEDRTQDFTRSSRHSLLGNTDPNLDYMGAQAYNTKDKGRESKKEDEMLKS